MPYFAKVKPQAMIRINHNIGISLSPMNGISFKALVRKIPKVITIVKMITAKISLGLLGFIAK